MDVKRLHTDILTNLSTDPIAKAHLSDSSNPQWSTNEAGYLRLNGRIYVPEADNLCLCVLKYKHDHPLSGHFVGDIWGYPEINVGKSVHTYARCSLHSVV